MSPRRGSGPRCAVIWWGDIPSQVVVRDGTTTLKAALPPRFQRAIDRAAMGGGQAGSDSYLAGWTRTERGLPSAGVDLAAVLDAEVAELEQRFPDDALERVIAATRLARRADRSRASDTGWSGTSGPAAPQPTGQQHERTQ